MIGGTLTLLQADETSQLAMPEGYLLYQGARFAGLEQVTFDHVNITFTVNESWLANTKATAMAMLYADNDTWQEAPLTKTEDNTYTATIPATPTTILLTAQQERHATTAKAPPTAETPYASDEKENDFWIFYFIGLFFIVTLIVGGALLFIKHRAQAANDRRQPIKTGTGKHEPSAPPALHDYIARMRSQGFNDAIIREKLLTTGWNRTLVQQSLAEKQQDLAKTQKTTRT